MSQARLAKLVGASQSDIARLEQGRRRLTANWIRRLADALRVEQAALLERVGDAVLPAPPSNIGPAAIPVCGCVMAGQDECIDLVRPLGHGQVAPHPRQIGEDGAFAAEVAGTSMLPRYRPGEVVYALLDRRPEFGDDCIVELTGGRGFLKEFRTRTSTQIVCWQHHPPGEWCRPLEEVLAVHLVVGRG